MLIRGMGTGRGMGYGGNSFNSTWTPYSPPPAGAPPAAPPAGAPPAAAPAGNFWGTALAVAQLLPISGAYDMPRPPPAPVPPVVLSGGGSPASTGPAVPVSGSITFATAIGATAVGPGGPNAKGPNETALDAAMAAAGVTTDDQASAWLSSLDGQPAPQFLTETSAAYYLGILAKKQQEAKYLKWGMVGAGVLGLALLLK